MRNPDRSKVERTPARSSPSPSAYRRVLLVGIMGSGKTSVGSELAGRLGWAFRDIDLLLEADFGFSVSGVFKHFGEGIFRSAEADVTARELEKELVVVSPGGGWAAQNEARLCSMPPSTLSVWLRTTPECALERLNPRPNTIDPGRPLLKGEDPLGTLSRLAVLRAPSYSLARAVVDTDGLEVSEVVSRIEEMVRHSTAPRPPSGKNQSEPYARHHRIAE